MKQRNFLFFVLLVSMLLLCSTFVFGLKWALGPSPNGTYDDWQSMGCSSGSLEYTCVQTYGGGFLFANISGMNETFPFPDFNLSIMNGTIPNYTIHNITVFNYGKKSNSTVVAQISPLFVSNGSEFVDSAFIGFLNIWDYRQATFDINPFTGNAWTAQEFNDLEVGMQSSENNTGTNIGNLFIMVDYN